MDIFSVLLALVILLLGVAAFLLLRAQKRYRFHFGVPGPAPHFFSGNSYSLKQEYGSFRRHVMVQDYFKKYGPTFVCHLPLGLRALVFTRDPVVSKAMTKNMDDFPTRNDHGNGIAEFIPLGLLGDIKGEQWKMHRRTLSPLFSERYLRWYTTTVNEQLLELQNFFRARSSTFVDVHSALTLFTLDVIGRVGFGTRFNALQDPKSRFVDAGKDILSVIVQFRAPWMPKNELYRKAVAGIETFNKVIDSILERKESELDNDDAKMNMLRAMQDATDSQSGRKLSRGEIRDEILTLLVAGHETTANTATWALHLLFKHPDVLAKVRQEIDGVKSEDSTLSRGLFEYDQIHSFVYTRQVVFETLRLYPTVPMFPRLATRDLELKQQNGKPLFLPKGTMIFSSTEQFIEGEVRDPSVFRPERFDSTSPFYDPAVMSKSFVPFGAGGRVCLGQRFAEMEAVQMIAAIVSQFDLVGDSQRLPVEYCDITLGPKESGLWMKVADRS